MWKVLVWNMALGSRPRRSPARNWGRLSELMDASSIDVALLSEASLPLPEGLASRHSEEGTGGWDGKRRHWTTAIVTRKEPPGAVEAVAIGGNGPRPEVPFQPSKPGVWTAGVVEASGIGSITCVSLYGLMDEVSDASVHRSLSDISRWLSLRIREARQEAHELRGLAPTGMEGLQRPRAHRRYIRVGRPSWAIGVPSRRPSGTKDHADVVARRGEETLVVEVKGNTRSRPGERPGPRGDDHH